MIAKFALHRTCTYSGQLVFWEKVGQSASATLKLGTLGTTTIVDSIEHFTTKISNSGYTL